MDPGDKVKEITDIGSQKDDTISDDNKQDETPNVFSDLRRSTREVKYTDRMSEYRQEEFNKRKQKLMTIFDKWKDNVRKFRNLLKKECQESVLVDIIVSVKHLESSVVEHFENLRTVGTITPDITRKVDACVAISADLLKIVNERLCEIEDFDLPREKDRLRKLRDNDYAKSIFSESALTEKSKISQKMVDASVELAAKTAEYRMVQEEEVQRAKLIELEHEQKIQMQAQQSELKRIAARNELEIANARLGAYSRINEFIQGQNEEPGASNILQTRVSESDVLPTRIPETSILPTTVMETYLTSTHQNPILYNTNNGVPNIQNSISHLHETHTEKNVTTDTNNNSNALAKALAESVNLNRLPVQKPNIFNGDPLQYMEWKTSFEMLIDRKGVPTTEKIFYLKKYVGGAARKALEGYFYNNSQTAYDNARKVLEERYGHPFIMQKAFRDKLASWPRIAPKDPIALRDFADFLQGCRDAIPHVPSLSILNDCTENQKLLKKLPDWASVRWNREGTQSLDISAIYPSLTNSPNNSTSAIKTVVCEYCKKVGHYIFKCEKFLSISIANKRLFVRENNLCYGCLRKGHLNKDCNRKHSCNPSCLHEERPRVRQQSSNVPDSNAVNNVELKPGSSLRVSQHNGQSTSMIVPVWVSHKDKPSREILTYALLDTQSDTTFILDNTAASLHIPCEPIRLSLSTMTSQHTVIESSKVCGLQVRGFKSSESEKVTINNAYTRDFIPADRWNIPEKNTVKDWSHVQEITDDLPLLQSCEIGLLIGSNCPQAIPLENEPYAVKTQLGWSVVGYSDTISDESSIKGVTHRTSVKELQLCSPKDLINVLESDFAPDMGHLSKQVSQDGIRFLSIMHNSIHQLDNKHLKLPLPFKERPTLPNNKSQAIQRLAHLKRRLINDHKHYEQYKIFMREIIENGDAELVQQETTSAKYKNETLNQHLLTGPDLINGLSAVLCRFRQYPVAIMCDIEKMFHQFKVPESDRDFLQFLWWKDGDIHSENEPLEYRMKVHLFGAASSPGCANYGLKYLAKLQEVKYLDASHFIQYDFYVDDGLTSVETETQAIKLVNDAQRVCVNEGLRLHKFISNRVNVMDSIPHSERASGVKDLNLALENLPVERALGVQWSVEEDVFSFQTKIQNTLPTRRNMLSIVASIFDPLGFVCPFLLKGKRILQGMCQNGVGWDDMLPNSMSSEWQSWIDDIPNPQYVKIPRCLKPADFGQPTSIELHHFRMQVPKDMDNVRDPEVKSINVNTLCTKSDNVFPSILEGLNRFSCWSTAISVMARLQRLSNGIKGKQSPSVQKRQRAEMTILKLV
ncbi:unnamed protein product [Mytilus coruscus]|uniref:CCHC-type domain-containing protein n=1 Tax=Mytilus coruscus TaxID=42192 RepID=A0A6J8E9S3_MYTCO|nr:unnamed protein product [Mytilus coruscus]